MGALAASIASHVPTGLLASLASSVANPGELLRRARRLEDEIRELLRVNGRRAGAAAAEQGTRERFLRAYERLKSELLNDRAFNFDFTPETRQWVAKVPIRAYLSVTWRIIKLAGAGQENLGIPRWRGR